MRLGEQDEVVYYIPSCRLCVCSILLCVFFFSKTFPPIIQWFILNTERLTQTKPRWQQKSSGLVLSLGLGWRDLSATERPPPAPLRKNNMKTYYGIGLSFTCCSFRILLHLLWVHCSLLSIYICCSFIVHHQHFSL